MTTLEGCHLWNASKELSSIINSALVRKEHGRKPDLETALRKHRASLIALLKNPSRSTSDAELLRKSITGGLELANGTLATLSPQIVEEALIVSELFNLNELSSLELLLAGEEQLSLYPGSTRGLIAVLLYYDARNSLTQSLRSLFQSRRGVTWTLEISDEISDLTTKYTDALFSDGHVVKVLSLLSELDWISESSNLQKHMALGNPKHRKTVSDLFEDTRRNLAESLFCFSAQSGLPLAETSRLLFHLSKVREIDTVTLILLSTALYAFDLSSLSRLEDKEYLLTSLPLLSDSSYIPFIAKDLETLEWSNSTILSILLLSWSLMLGALRSSIPHCSSFSSSSFLSGGDEDENMVDKALELRVFLNIKNLIEDHSSFLFQEEFHLRRLHGLLTDLIFIMPLRVKELRNKAEDAERIKVNNTTETEAGLNVQPASHFEALLMCLGALYSKDPLHLHLVNDYWSSSESSCERYSSERLLSLHKFVRLAGDLLLPSLFSPYVSLLASLSSHPFASSQSFTLLRSSGSLGSVSLDHFFSSLHTYFSNLRRESKEFSQIGGGVFMDIPCSRGISPLELKGLGAVLRLLRNLAKYSDFARCSLLDHSSWQPILVLNGLLSCAVPTDLKAELLKVLAALAKSPEGAGAIWNSLESSQLIPTISSKTTPGLLTELEEIETRREEYPMTRAFLKLMDALTEHPLPSHLGLGVRAPGFDPYLEAIRDSIFLRFSSRPYKNPGEKWKVSSLSLKILQKVLRGPSSSSSSSSIRDSVSFSFDLSVGASPRLTLMIHLLQNSQMLRTLLSLLHESVTHFDSYISFPGQKHLESSTRYALSILHLGLKYQNEVLNAARLSKSSTLLLTSLDKLLFGLNPHSGRPDHILNIVKFIVYSSWLPSHTTLSLHILSFVSFASSSSSSALLSTVTSSSSTANEILKGFTDVLDAESVVSSHDNEDEETDHLMEAKLAILSYFTKGLSSPVPSLTHFLLGFDVIKGPQFSDLQLPGVKGTLRTPLHALLGLLRPLSSKTPSRIFFYEPILAAAAFECLYTLAAHHSTSEPLLRYLRSSEDFLANQLSLLPLSLSSLSLSNKTSSRQSNNNNSLINTTTTTSAIMTPTNSAHYQSVRQDKNDDNTSVVHVSKAVYWLLKTIAIELKVVSSNRLRSQIHHLTELLLDTGAYFVTSTASSFRESDNYFGAALSRSCTEPSKSSSSLVSNQHRLLSLLHSIDFSEHHPTLPSWELFDDEQVRLVLSSVEKMDSSSGAKRLDVTELQEILSNELSILGDGASSLHQRNLIQGEIQNILLYAVRWNAVQEESLTRRNLLESWRQVTEVLLCSLPNDILPPSSKQQLLLELLQSLLNKVLEDGTMAELSNQVSGLLLLLLSALRSTYVVLSDHQLNSIVYSSALQVILKGLLSWIVGTNARAQRVRSNLYGALLHYLRIGKGGKEGLETSDFREYRKSNLEVLLSFGDNFLEIVCRDSVSGHDIRRMLSMSVLDELIALDGVGSTILYLSTQGYLRHFIESLTNDDEKLSKACLSSSSTDTRALYIYESKMSLLSRLSCSRTGAELLLESGLCSRLSELAMYSSRPESNDSKANCPLLSRYHQILFPALKLLMALLSSLGGTYNKSASAQIFLWILSNDDYVRSLLRIKSLKNLLSLREMSHLTGLLCRVAVHEDLNNLSLESSQAFYRIQRQMISLIPSLIVNMMKLGGEREGVVFSSNKSSSFDESSQFTNEVSQLTLEVLNNVLTYARNLLLHSSKSCKYVKILFGPCLAQVFSESEEGEEGSNVSIRPPSLSHLVFLLKSLSSFFLSNSSILADLRKTNESLHCLSSAELSPFLSSQISDKVSSSSEQRRLVSLQLKQLLRLKEHGSQLASSAIESTAFLLWRHLEHYLLIASEGISELKSVFQDNRRSCDEISSSLPGTENRISTGFISSEDLIRLKDEIISVFNDALFIQLTDVETLIFKSNNKDVFLKAMIRKLKRVSSLYT